MPGTSRSWERYQRWSAAIAQVVYPTVEVSRPVYLDLEDDVLEAIRDAAEPEAADPTTALAKACRDTFVFHDGPARVLKGHLDRLQRWRAGSQLEPPPTLGVLALLSLAAEQMRQSDDMASHNFYGRLGELAQLDEDQRKLLENAYRRVASGSKAASRLLWESLNDWHEALEGARGEPSAHPLGHEHIGWALSQALVRQADRDKLAELFASYRLPAHGLLAQSEMAALIDEWMSRQPCPATSYLRRLWEKWPATRARIAEIACLALEEWDGTTPSGASDAQAREIDAVRVRALLRAFPSRRLALSPVVPAHAQEDLERLEILDLHGAVLDTLEMVPVASGWLGVGDPSQIDAASFLGGEVRLRRAGFSQPLKRRSRRLAVLRWNDLLSSYVETERAQLGEESMLLARTEIADQVFALLEQAARAGFRRLDGLAGLPSGWTAFDGVQILSSIPPELLKRRLVDLHALQPMATSQTLLHGGLRLPGHLRKWHAGRAPELRASVAGAAMLTATLTCTRALTSPAPPEESCSVKGPVLIWDLAGLHLPDGDYEIEVTSDDETPVDTFKLRLRTADNPAVQLAEHATPIVHDPQAAGFGLLAARSASPRAFHVAPDGLGPLHHADPPTTPSWWTARRRKPREAGPGRVIRFPEDTKHSCVRTGAHHMDLPIAEKGSKTVEGVCRHCGLVKRYPARFTRKRAKASRKQGPPVLDVSQLPAARAEEAIDWGIAFDAVCHVGAGSSGALERITAQMEGTALFGDAFARQLEVLGHIEILRSPMTMAFESWRVSDPMLIQVESGDFVLTGFRSEALLVALEDAAYAIGAAMTTHESGDAPPRVVIRAIEPDDAKQLAAALGDAARRPTRVVRAAARALAGQLPPLRAARAGLPTTLMPAGTAYERWEPRTAHFEPAPDAEASGAFRVVGSGRRYLYRREEDVATGRATLADARIVKYLAAADAGISLIGYDESSRILYVPLGADLPGMYGRSAVLASGRPPLPNEDERILQYCEIPPALAAHLDHLLVH